MSRDPMTPLRSDSARAEFLRAVPILTGLSEELRAEVAARSTGMRLPAGAWLFRQGDRGDSLYVVRSGRLEAVVETPLDAALEAAEPAVIRVLDRGAIVGELALLTGSTRSASVRARRDSELLELTRADFAELMAKEPEFAFALTRELGRQLQVSRALASAERPVPTTVTVVPLSEAGPLRAVCEGILSALERAGPVARLERPAQSCDPSDYGPLLDRAEREHRQVLLVTGVPEQGDSWTAFCLRQSDRVVCIAGEEEPPDWLERFPQLQGCDLLLLGPGARPTRIGRWLAALRPRARHTVREEPAFAADLSRAGRRLAGRSVGLVLSGGGARGLAHIGVLAELRAAGIEIDRVGGCSMGAFVGAMFADERRPDEIHDRCREEFVERNPLGDYTVPLVSLLRGARARAMLLRTFGSRRIEDLPRDYFCVSCDLLSGDLVVHRDGPLLQTVGASMSLPGVFAPMARDDRLLVDGGVRNNLPVDPMAATAEGPVIAVDVTARFLPPEARAGGGMRARVRELATRARSAVVGAETPLPRLKDTLARAIGIGSVEAVEAARRRADLLISPDTGLVGLLEFDQLDRMVEIGREAARAALAAAPGLGDGA